MSENPKTRKVLLTLKVRPEVKKAVRLAAMDREFNEEARPTISGVVEDAIQKYLQIPKD